MVLSTVIELPDEVVATVQGTLTTGDEVRIVEWIRASIRPGETVRVPLRFEAFAGWGVADAAIDHAVRSLHDDEPVTKIASSDTAAGSSRY